MLNVVSWLLTVPRAPPCQVVRWPALVASLTGPDLHARHEAWQTVLHALGGQFEDLAGVPPKLVSDLAEMSV